MSTRAPLIAVASGLVLAACVPAAAGAAGAPVPSWQTGRAGAVAPGGTERLVTSRAPDGGTLVRALRRGDGKVLRSRRVDGRWTVAPVTLTGATTGLSADGGTAVLVRPVSSFPSRSTRFAVLGAKDLRVRREIELPGFLTLDAVSPDGSSAYVIQYLDESMLNYRVRALDTRTGRLDARDVVDPRKPGERMGGMPMSRVTSADGRWAYTLYGGGAETFVHALDTVGRTAACIDLEMLPTQSDLSSVRMHVSGDGRRLILRDGGELVATVDTRTFAVTEPGAPRAAAAAVAPAPAAPAADDGDGTPWLIALLAAILLTLVIAVTIARRRGRGTIPMHRPEV